MAYTFDDAGLLGILPYLFLAHQEDVNALDDFGQLSMLGLDPKFHGIENRKTRPLHLLQYFHLQLWLNVRQEKQWAAPIRLRDDRMEARIYAKLGIQRISRVHIHVVA